MKVLVNIVSLTWLFNPYPNADLFFEVSCKSQIELTIRFTGEIMSESTQSFTSQAGPAVTGDIPEVGVGMLGYAFMGKAHSNAFRTIPYMIYPPPAIPRMVFGERP